MINKTKYSILLMTILLTSPVLKAAGSDDECESKNTGKPFMAPQAKAPRGNTQTKEAPRRYYYDGALVYGERAQIERTPNGGRRVVRAYDHGIDGHIGNEICHVDLFDIGDGVHSPKEGNYHLIKELLSEGLPGRDQTCLFFSNGQGRVYLPTVTQEKWERETIIQGAFVASYNEERDVLRFVRDSEIYKGNDPFWGALPRGLYQVVSVDETGPRRKEFWRYLHNGKPNVEGELYTLTSPLGCSSIPGLGGTAPRLVPFHSTDNDINELYRGIEECERRLQKFIPKEDVESVIAIGPAGAGKTSLIHLLARKNLRVKDTIYGLRLESDPDDPLPEDFHISHLETGTKYPAVWLDEINGRYLVDCPGFEDIRGASAEALNAVSIEKILKNRKNAKIVLVVPESNLDARAGELQKFLKRVCNLFIDHTALMASASLIVTKQGRVKSIKDKISNNLGILSHDHPIRPLLQFLVDNERISSLPFPTEEGVYLHPESFEGVEAAINSATASDFPAEMIRVRPNAEAREDMIGLAEELSGALSTYLQVQGTPAVIAFVKDVVRKHQGSLFDLRAQLHHLADEFDQLSQGTTQEEDFMIALNPYMNLEELQKRIEQIRFLTMVGGRKPHRDNEWMKALNSVGNKIRRYAAGPELEFNGSATYTLKGHLVGLSDVEQAIHRSPDSTLMRVFVSNRFFAGTDLTAPGKSLAILAPHWEVPSDRVVTIDLSGLPGTNGADGANGLLGHPGDDGEPGHPGQNGGHFFGKGYSITNPANLRITSDGGQGGNGGHGGRGGEGADGRDGNPHIVTEVSHNRDIFPRARGIYCHRGTDGEPGQPGGSFGLLGNGGKEGSIKVLLTDSEDIQISNKPGGFGANGHPGQGGGGGVHGKHSHAGVLYNGGFTKGFGPDRGRAPAGQSPNEPSSVIPREPTPSVPLDTMGILLSYEAFLNLKPLAPQTNEFAEIFPGLGCHELASHIRSAPNLPETDSETDAEGQEGPSDGNEEEK